MPHMRVERLLMALIVGLAIFLPGVAALAAGGSATRIEVPVSQRRLSNGDIRFAVSVRVGRGAATDKRPAEFITSRRRTWESEGLIVASKPGNAGGAKGRRKMDA